MIRKERRVQAFVILAIAVFVAGGIAANRYVTASNHDPRLTSVGDAVLPPRPQETAARSLPPAPTPVPKKAPRHTIRHAPKARPAAAGAAGAKGAPAETAAVSLTNAQRSAHGCNPLRVDSRLRTAAREHSADMHDRHYFEHDTPDGTTAGDRIKAVGYAMPGAENIGQGYPTAQAVLNGWMNSSGHRANILNCVLKAVGIGVEHGQGGPWWTQDFGFQ